MKLDYYIFDKYAVAACGLVDKHVSYRADKLTVLNYRTAGHC